MLQTQVTSRVLGINFFTGTPLEAVKRALAGGLVVLPSAPVLVTASTDPATQESLVSSDLALGDSGLMVQLWRLLHQERISRISGLEYLQLLLSTQELRRPGAVFWVMPTQEAWERTLRWLSSQNFPAVAADAFVAPHYGSGQIEDPILLRAVEAAKPAHVVLAIGGGVQERVGYYLRRNLTFVPGIHCIGAAIAFLTGDQVAIPTWADRMILGWLFRCLQAPRRFVPRYWEARKLLGLLIRFGRTAPALSR